MITMRNMVAKAAQWPIRAFTLLESLVTLAVVAFLTLSLSGSVTGIFQQVETNLFYLQQQLTGVRVKALAADSIYANNANRKFCTKYHISTSNSIIFD